MEGQSFKTGVWISEKNVSEITDVLRPETAFMLEMTLGNGLPSFANFIFDTTSPSAMLLAEIFVGKISKENFFLCVPSFDLEKSVSAFMDQNSKFITLITLDDCRDRKSFLSKVLEKKPGVILELDEDRRNWLNQSVKVGHDFFNLCQGREII